MSRIIESRKACTERPDGSDFEGEDTVSQYGRHDRRVERPVSRQYGVAEFGIEAEQMQDEIDSTTVSAGEGQR